MRSASYCTAPHHTVLDHSIDVCTDVPSSGFNSRSHRVSLESQSVSLAGIAPCIVEIAFCITEIAYVLLESRFVSL